MAASEFDGILAWAVGQANAADLDEVHARVEQQMPDNGAQIVDAAAFFACNGHAQPTSSQATASSGRVKAPFIPAGSLYVEHLEADFWTRTSLKEIYDVALMQSCSPWAVLSHCVARALAQIRPCVTLPDVICGPGSLNWIGANVASSAGGKGGATAVARQLVPTSVKVYNLGSGEGVVDRYMSKATKTNPASQIHESLMFNADEIDSVAALASRNGATLMSVIRSGFSGELLGDSYIRSSGTPPLEPHSYRMTLMVSVQPERAGWLLDGAAGGTLQRVMWFPAIDRRVKASGTRAKISPLSLPDPASLYNWQTYPVELTIPAEAEQLIREEAVRRHCGETDALDGHALFSREKFAFGLALLDGRVVMDTEDWRLSGIAAEVSTFIRRQVTVLREAADDVEAQKAGRIHGVMREAADAEKGAATERRITAVGIKALAKLGAEPSRRMSQSVLTKSFTSRDRAALRAALTGLEGAGLITRTTDKSTNPPTVWVSL